MNVEMLGRLTPVFLNAVDSLSDASFAQPTALPGWTRAHVIAHVHSNAEALRRLVSWARTGQESRMYTSPAHRAEEIESGAHLAPDALRALVHASATTLTTELAELTPAQRANVVITAQGRSIPAEQIPWLRCREVGVHAVDLASGVTFADLPDDFLEALVQEVVAKRTAAGELAALSAMLTGRARTEDSIGAWL
jgi:maleylpyruvate isomerase